MSAPVPPRTCSLAELPAAWQAWQDAGATGLAALLGQPVAHSVSPAMHQAAFAAAGLPYAYIACEVAPAELPAALALLADLGATGCNVTIPHKKAALALAAAAGGEATAAGAANCLTWTEDGWQAANTDVTGLTAALTADHGLSLAGRAGVVIGAGGFARAAVVALLGAGCRAVTVLSRRPEAALGLATDLVLPAAGTVTGLPLASPAADRALGAAAACINATPAGMWPDTDSVPLDPARLGPDCFVYDSVYNPAETRLLREAAARGLPGAGGISLLARQGADSWRHWFGYEGPVTVMREAARAALAAR